MSVYVSDFKQTPWQTTHDDPQSGAHQGTVAPTDVIYAQRPDGTPDFRTLVVSCPVCGSPSAHPVAGGAQAHQVQEMFVRKLMQPGQDCPCGNLTAGKPLLLIIGHLRGHAEQQDYPGRWLITTGDIT